MTGFAGRIVIAALSFALGFAFLTASRLERRAVTADQMLATLQYAEPIGTYDEVEQSVGYTGVPWLTDPLLTNVRAHHATATYWQSAYDTLALQRDSAGGIVEKDPQRLFVGANAAYRDAERATGDRAAIVKRLEDVLKNYTDVMKIIPGHMDAAYNFEYVVRMRNALIKSPGAATKLHAQGTQPDTAGDLPVGPTLHGLPGGFPSAGSTTQFKMVVPMRPDERQKQPDAPPGRGSVRVRKG